MNVSNFSNYLPVVSACAVVSSHCANKISTIVNERINATEMRQTHKHILKMGTISILQISVVAFSALYATMSTVLFIAACVLAIAYKRLNLMTLFNATEVMFQDIIEKNDPLTAFEKLRTIPYQHPSLYSLAEEYRAKIMNAHPEIPSKAFLSNFSDLIPFARTYGVTRLKLVDELSRKNLETLVESLPNLEHLDISNVNIDLAGIKLIVTKLQNLTSLNLSGCNIDDTGIQTIVLHLKKLQALDISSCSKIDSKGIRLLAQLKLTKLVVFKPKDDDIVFITQNIKTLTSLTLEKATLVTNLGIKAIVDNLPALTSLKITSSDQIGLAEIELISTKLTNLAELSFFWCKINNDCLQMISENLKKLKLLSLESCKEIDNEGVGFIAEGLQELTSLSIHDCGKVGSLGLQKIAQQLTKLKSLSIISSIKLDDATIKCICEHLKSLSYLKLNFCKLDALDVVNLIHQLENLITISLIGCEFDEEAHKMFVQAPRTNPIRIIRY